MAGVRRVAVNILLVALFAVLAAVITAPLAAELRFNTAQDLDAKYRWRKAEASFVDAIRIGPFNSQYLAGFGEFLLRQARYAPRKTPWLERAMPLYERALRLNPDSAEYAAKSGEIQLRLFLEGEGSDPGLARQALRDFKRAVRNDPNGLNASYMAGYAGIAMWEILDEEEKDFVLERLKYSLKVNPYYCKYIYPRLWEKTKDFKLLQRVTPEGLGSNKNLYNFIVTTNLWQFRKNQKEIVDLYRKKEEPDRSNQELQDRLNHLKSIKNEFLKNNKEPKITDIVDSQEWTGKSADGKNNIVNGRMYWNGTIYAVIAMKAGAADIQIEAKKELVIKTDHPEDAKYNPYMIVRLDDEEIGETYVAGDDWQNYAFSVRTGGEVKVLSITFVNDIYAPEKGEDRNLFIGSANITYHQ